MCRAVDFLPKVSSKWLSSNQILSSSPPLIVISQPLDQDFFSQLTQLMSKHFLTQPTKKLFFWSKKFELITLYVTTSFFHGLTQLSFKWLRLKNALYSSKYFHHLLQNIKTIQIYAIWKFTVKIDTYSSKYFHIFIIYCKTLNTTILCNLVIYCKALKLYKSM